MFARIQVSLNGSGGCIVIVLSVARAVLPDCFMYFVEPPAVSTEPYGALLERRGAKALQINCVTDDVPFALCLLFQKRFGSIKSGGGKVPSGGPENTTNAG